MAIQTNLIAASLVAAALAATGSHAAQPPDPGKACFLSRDWRGWTAPGDGDALYFRVGLNGIYRVDLTPGTHVHKTGDRFLLVKERGSNWICSPLDLDLALSDPTGSREPLIGRSLRKLTPQEVAVIPRKDLP